MSVNGTMINRIDKENFPYSAYHLYCSPPNAKFAVEPRSVCDPYSNPQAQELVQLLPHPEWAVHGYPKKKGDGWIGDSRTWFLDVGALSDRLYFYQVCPALSSLTSSFPSSLCIYSYFSKPVLEKMYARTGTEQVFWTSGLMFFTLWVCITGPGDATGHQGVAVHRRRHRDLHFAQIYHSRMDCEWLWCHHPSQPDL